ncbi:MAG: aminopeptidase N, partial [Gammaproteobacteria bacterium]|nr:aminopeptidase N [Gammaproteobacteria bacterium]
DSNPQTIHLKNYAPPGFLVDHVLLDIDLRANFTEVTATLKLARNPQAKDPDEPLVLQGDELQLLEVSIDGRPLNADEYSLTDSSLSIPGISDSCKLYTRVRILPEKNTQLMGLYASRDGYFTQCEAEGFRRITYFLDRPDVMTRFTTVIHADRERFPLLLSNGNLDASGDEDGGRHWARWVDPFPKPSYLFAMVAARLDRLDSEFTTMSGRAVKLTVFVQPGKLDQCDFAMESLKSAMRWDEEVFGLELDLDQYMIVAVDDFNMGAMENKGLNIFNTRYVLARAETATDHDFQMLDRVVAHEYFHNWTGNRVTCRDWFQLSLKEGLTVFRDQQYGGDRYSHALQRIEEVRLLRSVQFPEDAGPMAHPVRPESYIEISNFYTATVYNKGAELVRMIHTLLGAKGFRAGMDLYFQRHDGQAVRTEEFIAAMQDASGVDLDHFSRWYSQAGTPVVEASGEYDGARKRFTLTLRQHCPPTHGQPDKQPLHIPVAAGLVTALGDELPLCLEGDDGASDTTRILSLTEAEQHFVFTDVAQPPVPSLLRGFSAPVILRYEYSDAQLALLMAHDSDAFNRWEAGQRLAMRVLLQAIDDHMAGRALDFAPEFIDACARLLDDSSADPAFVAEVLSLPNAGYIAEHMDEVDPDAILTVRVALRRKLATTLETVWRRLWSELKPSAPYSPAPEAAGRRALRNTALGYLAELDTPEVRGLCLSHLTGADNMTGSMCALALLANSHGSERQQALAWFWKKWQHESLVVDKWFSVQAASRLPDTLDQVRDLLTHPAFSMKNPNRVRALIGTFCQANHAGFNAADGSGYTFAADQVIALDPLNPQIAARMARSFDRWRKFDAGHQVHARNALTRIAAKKGLSRDCYEVVTRALDETG